MITTVIFVLNCCCYYVSWCIEVACETDYSPCSCQTFFVQQDPDGDTFEKRVSVVCHQVSASDIRNIFVNKPLARRKNIFSLEIQLPAAVESQVMTVETIPAHLLNGTRVKRIRLTCPSSSHQLKIDSDAFRSSQTFLNEFFVQNCDLKETDFSFLAEFKALNELYIHSSKLGVIQGLPSDLPLKILDIYHCPDLKWNISSLPSTLTSLRLEGNHLTDDMTDAVLRSILASKNHSLVDLMLSHNELSHIPEAITSLGAQFRNLKLKNNPISAIGGKSFSFLEPHQLSVLNLGKMSLNYIESGAFQGAASSLLPY